VKYSGGKWQSATDEQTWRDIGPFIVDLERARGNGEVKEGVFYRGAHVPEEAIQNVETVWNGHVGAFQSFSRSLGVALARSKNAMIRATGSMYRIKKYVLPCFRHERECLLGPREPVHFVRKQLHEGKWWIDVTV
jgi:hypothetical protein